MKRSLAIFVFLMLALLTPAAARPAIAQEPRCFPETGFCIEGRFRAYWEQNGGLPVFGYPITPARQEINRDTGQSYLTQWFERNRFELHPENAPPYDVLLGRLSDERLRQSGIDWNTFPREQGLRQGCLWFEQTGRNVCNQAGNLGFLSFWRGRGLQDNRLDAYARSLALFGLPLTEPRPETNASGDLVLTQWFERARFEWHPDKPDEYKVLLGLLGSELASTPQTPQTIEYTALGDSLAVGLFARESYVARFRAYITADTGLQITLTNLGRSGWTSGELLQALRTDPSFRQAVARSRVVTWDIGGNDLSNARARYQARTCGGADNQDCLRLAVAGFKSNWDAITAEIVTLANRNTTMLRTMDIYNPYVARDSRADSWADDGGRNDFAVFKPYLDEANAHIAATSAREQIPMARVYTAFNGPDGTNDPVATGLIAFDGMHPNEAGHTLMADLLRGLAYRPVR
jgi:lysophospholipase L1-like esterase